MPTQPFDALAHAAWFVRHKRRWPLILNLALGLSIASAGILAGLGVAQAHANLPLSTAAVAALKRPPMDAALNAAPIWDRAASFLAPWRGPRNQDPYIDDNID